MPTSSKRLITKLTAITDERLEHLAAASQLHFQRTSIMRKLRIDHGMTWDEIASIAGVTRQAVMKSVIDA